MLTKWSISGLKEIEPSRPHGKKIDSLRGAISLGSMLRITIHFPIVGSFREARFHCKSTYGLLIG
jgi:hypothetical protein